METQREQRRVVQVDLKTLVIHLAIHVVAVGLATAAVIYMLRGYLSASSLPAAVFVFFAVAFLPAQLIFNQVRTGKSARLGRWIIGLVVVSVVILIANHLVRGVS